MLLMAIDPGTTHSAFVLLETETNDIIDAGLMENGAIADMIDIGMYEHMAIEGFQSFGMPVGKEVFETAYFIGRLTEKALIHGIHTDMVFRSQVKLHHCNSARAKDPNVRQVMLDRFGKPGTKKNQGKTYGFKKDMWSALAIASYWSDTHK